MFGGLSKKSEQPADESTGAESQPPSGGTETAKADAAASGPAKQEPVKTPAGPSTETPAAAGAGDESIADKLRSINDEIARLRERIDGIEASGSAGGSGAGVQEQIKAIYQNQQKVYQGAAAIHESIGELWDEVGRLKAKIPMGESVQKADMTLALDETIIQLSDEIRKSTSE